MKAYLLGHYSIFDEKKHLEYIKHVGLIVAKYKGITKIADHEPKILEGSPEKNNTVLVEFPSQNQALNFYNSKEYQKIINFRKESSNGWVVILPEFNINTMSGVKRWV